MTIRILLIILAFVAGSLNGVFLQQKVFAKKVTIPECPTCPSLTCPPAVSLNSFDADKLNNKKGNFHLHNTISNVQIKIESKDSLLFKQFLKQAR